MHTGQEPSKLRTALSRYVQARSTALAEARRELSIGEGDAKALLFISDNPGCRAADIATHLGITAAGVTALVDRLVERGVVKREYDRTIARDPHLVHHRSRGRALGGAEPLRQSLRRHPGATTISSAPTTSRSMLDELLGEIAAAIKAR